MAKQIAVSPIWSQGVTRNSETGMVSVHGETVEKLREEYGTPLYVMDTDEVSARAEHFVAASRNEFRNITTHVSFAGKAFLSKEIVRIVTEQGIFVDTCSLGEMSIALAAGVPGRRLILHGNNKTDAEIRLAIENNFDKIVIDSVDEPERIAVIAHDMGKRVRVMVRVTVGIHAGGHEYISTAHEDQKFGISLLKPGADASALDAATEVMLDEEAADSEEKSAVVGKAMDQLAEGDAIATLKKCEELSEDLELVGIHSHIGSQIHDANAFIEAAKRVLLLRQTFWATDGAVLPEIDLGGGYSVAYTDEEDSMDIDQTMADISDVVSRASAHSIPAPVVSFEPGRYIVAPAGVTLYTVGTVKPVHLSDGTVRTYVSVDGGMSDNIRPALYGAAYTATLANRTGSSETMLARVVGMHCESGDIVVDSVQLPSDIKRGDILAVPVTGAYGHTMSSNYNKALRPAVVSVNASESHVMIRRDTIEDLLGLDVSE